MKSSSNHHLPSTPSLIHRGKKNRKLLCTGGGGSGGGKTHHVLLEGSLHDSASTLDSIDIIPTMIDLSSNSSSMFSLDNNNNNNSSISSIRSNHDDSLDASHSFHGTGTGTCASYNRSDKSLSLSRSYHPPKTTKTTTPPPRRPDYDEKHQKKNNTQKRLHQRNTIRPSQKRQLLESVPNIPYNFYGGSSNKDNGSDDDLANEKNESINSSSSSSNNIFSQRHRRGRGKSNNDGNDPTAFMFRILRITAAFTLIILLMFVGGFIIEIATRQLFDQAGSTTRSRSFIEQQQKVSQQQQEQQRSGPIVPTAPRTATVTEGLLEKLKEDSRIHESELHALQEELSKVKEHEHQLAAELTGLRLNQLTSQNNLRGGGSGGSGTGAPAGATSAASSSAESDNSRNNNNKSDTGNNVAIMKDDYNPYRQNPGERYIHLLNRSPSPIQLFWINQEHVLDEERHLVEWVVVETSSATMIKSRVATTLENGDETIIQEGEGKNLILPGTTYHFHARPYHRFAIERAGASENSHGSIKDHLFFDVPGDDEGYDENSDGDGGDVTITNGDDPLVIVTESWELDIQRI